MNSAVRTHPRRSERGLFYDRGGSTLFSGLLDDPLLQRFIEPTQLGLGSLPIGNISGDLRGPDDVAAIASDRGNGQ